MCYIKENGRKHSIHHIDYNKKNCDPDNLMLLCVSCHAKTGINRNFWQLYLTNKMVVE